MSTGGSTQTEAGKKAISTANKARMNATRRIIEMHQQEYDDILAAERLRLGLAANPELEKKRKQLEAAQARVRALEADLNGQTRQTGTSIT